MATSLFYLLNRSMENRAWPLLVAAVIFFTGLSFLNGRFLASSSESESQRYLNPPPEHIEYFHFGFRDSLADSLWLRWIQDSDACQTYEGFEGPETTPIDPEVRKGLLDNPRHKICDGSWGFKMLDAVTRLSPRFFMPYLTGAATLAVLIEDYTGATVLFERGLNYYPDDWQLLYLAAYHYQFDLKDPAKAAEYLLRAADAGGKPWFRSLASRLLTKAGQLELGLNALRAYRKTQENDPKALKEIDERIQALEAQMEP